MIISYPANPSVLESKQTLSTLPSVQNNAQDFNLPFPYSTKGPPSPLLSSPTDSRITVFVRKRACKWTVYTNQIPGTQKTKHFNIPPALLTREKHKDELMGDWWQNIKTRGINKVVPRSQEREAI